MTREDVLQEAQAKIDAAYINTPPEYHGFITLIGRYDKRLGVNIQTAYMKVDGRVAMAVDEHRELGKRLEIHTDFDTVFDKPICRALIVSELKGETSGTAEVKLGGSGVDSTNPLENAETSAIGRALGFMGYGLLGGGIASAEEVEQAMAEQEKASPAPKSTKVAEADPYDIPEKPRDNGDFTPASDKQMQFLRGLLAQKGTLKGDSLPLIERVYKDDPLTRVNVSADIEALQASDRLTDKYLGAYLGTLRESANLKQQDIYDYLKKYFNVVKIKDITREQQDQLIGWLAVGQKEDHDWEGMINYVGNLCGVGTDVVQGWLDTAFDGKEQDDIVARVADMSDDDIKADVASYRKATAVGVA